MFFGEWKGSFGRSVFVGWSLFFIRIYNIWRFCLLRSGYEVFFCIWDVDLVREILIKDRGNDILYI